MKDAADKTTNMAVGDAVIIEAGHSFVQVCCGCGLAHTWTVRYDSDARMIALDVKDAKAITARERRKTETKQSIEAIYKRFVLGRKK